jgi:hypothetical protein
MKGISNRQKTVVKPRESIQKYISQQKTLRNAGVASDSRLARKVGGRRKK